MTIKSDEGFLLRKFISRGVLVILLMIWVVLCNCVAVCSHEVNEFQISLTIVISCLDLATWVLFFLKKQSLLNFVASGLNLRRLGAIRHNKLDVAEKECVTFANNLAHRHFKRHNFEILFSWPLKVDFLKLVTPQI